MTDPAADPMFRQLAELQSSLSALGGMFDELGRMAPARSAGSDRSGAVQVSLDQAGFPRQILIADTWSQRIRPEALAGAVQEAFMAAATERGAAWKDAADRSGWERRLDLLAEPARTPPPGPEEIPAAFRRPAAGPARPVGELAEDVMAALDQASAMADAPRAPARGSGSNRERTVTVRLGAGGRLSCGISAPWAARRSGTALTGDLADALAMAKRGLAAASAVDTTLADRMQALTAEVLESFGNPS